MTIDLDAYREQSLESWGAMAPGWADRREWLMDSTGRVQGWLVQKADPQPGPVFLDIAAGTGDLGFAIAERGGEGGRGYGRGARRRAAGKERGGVPRGGGPLAFAVWATPDRTPWAAVPAMTLVQRGQMPPPEPGAPGMFAMGDPGRVRELVTRAGFGAPELAEIAFDFRY